MEPGLASIAESKGNQRDVCHWSTFPASSPPSPTIPLPCALHIPHMIHLPLSSSKVGTHPIKFEGSGDNDLHKRRVPLHPYRSPTVAVECKSMVGDKGITHINEASRRCCKVQSYREEEDDGDLRTTCAPPTSSNPLPPRCHPPFTLFCWWW
jgi:hypothetical protein